MAQSLLVLLEHANGVRAGLLEGGEPLVAQEDEQVEKESGIADADECGAILAA